MARWISFEPGSLHPIRVSPHADQFLLKGVLSCDLWFDIPHWRTPAAIPNSVPDPGTGGHDQRKTQLCSAIRKSGFQRG